ncbi:hypothetical protein GH741_15560 [Aquibacillus halophilus]|uniref:Uncharacterized protein n=1 Tax=Aquibacillus halophilus TaxID=930132 RepID=A0A6A8DFP0_9BACI|nr:hypothetical protein [Aquibacillus halophilus]MRH44060.1 hypothetical protein [Aquibacillus halophilus]
MGTRKIYLLFSDTGTFLAKAINVYTKTPLNHASIAFDLSLEEVYSFGRKNQRNPFSGGFVKEDTRTSFFEKAKCAVYSFSITELEYERIRRRIQQMEEQKDHYKYNALGLLGVAFNRELSRENAYFCSQFVATILSECGIYQNDKPACLIRPQDLIAWHQLQLVYQGSLQAYPYYQRDISHTGLINKLNIV